MKRNVIALIILCILVFVGCKEENSKQESEDFSRTNQASVETEVINDELEFIFPKGQKGPDKNFTGNAYNYGMVMPDSTYTTIVGNVYFEPGARSNWHTHPAGQILIITDGVGYHQIEGQEVETITKGDVIKCPPNAKHWHGASADRGLQQMYIVPNTEKGIVNWMEAVTNEQYPKN